MGQPSWKDVQGCDTLMLIYDHEFFLTLPKQFYHVQNDVIGEEESFSWLFECLIVGEEVRVYQEWWLLSCEYMTKKNL